MPKTGVAVALRSGSVRVKYSTSEGETFYKDLNILGSAGIAIQSGIVLTKTREPVMVPVKFHNRNTNILTPISSPLEVTPGALFSCGAEWSDGNINQVFRVKPVLAQEDWACEFSPIDGASGPAEPVAVELTVEMDGCGVVRRKP